MKMKFIPTFILTFLCLYFSVDGRSPLNHTTHAGLIVNAGTDQTVTMPVQYVNLTGAAETSGNIKSVSWVEISDHAATISDSTSLTPKVSDLAAGIYVFRLTVTDETETVYDDVTVTVKPQNANGATNKTVVVLGSSTAIGYGLEDEDKYVNRLEKYIQGILPGSKVINLAVASFVTYKSMPDGFHEDGRPDPDPNKNITKALSFNPDAILINFPSNDVGNGYSLAEQKRNFLVITALADSAHVPVYVTSTQPRIFSGDMRDSLLVLGDWIMDTYGDHAIDFWTTFARPDNMPYPRYQQSDGVHFNAEGHKKLYARVASSSLISSIINYRPVADAGFDTSVFYPATSVNLFGAGTDADGTVQAYHWEKISGSGVITSPDAAGTAITGLTSGISVFRLTVTDNDGAKSSDEVTVYVNGASVLTAKAGNDTTISQLSGRTILDASKSEGAVSYQWERVSGTGTITRPMEAITTAQNITKNSIFRIKVTDNSGNVAFSNVKVNVTPEGFDNALNFNSNTKVPAIPDSMFFEYGTNLGYFGNGWTDTMLARLITDVGGKTTRSGLADWLITGYGVNTRVPEYTHIKNVLGLKDITTFLGEPHETHRDSTIFPGAPDMTKVFANLYTPVWKVVNGDTVVNENNYFAKYVYDVVQKYTPVGGMKFWEIVNEPDYTYFYDNSNPSNVNNWILQAPAIKDLANLNAPVYYYVRLLRVGYEVIKRLYPDSYVTPGGIGYSGFLDAILRYTDNPDGGKVTPDYPLKGGAYFDVLSFHSYPYNYLYKWTNDDGGHFVYFRNSDEAVKAMFDQNGLQKYLDVFDKFGYNGGAYPKKQFILSEYNIPRKMFESRYGGDTAQLNYIIKALVKTQQHGIVQSHIFALGEHADYSTNFEYDLMGLYENLERDKKGQQKLTLEGQAFKTTSKLLYGWKYDAERTNQLSLPSGVDGVAFKRGTDYRYVLWAVTKNDNSEIATAKYSFPGSFNITALRRYRWDYASDGKTQAVYPTNLNLTGTPVFLEADNSAVVVPNEDPTADAGKDVTITLPINTVTLNGTGKDDDGTIASYKWTKISGPSGYTIVSPNAATTEIKDLTIGVYQFQLTVTDDKGATATATVKVTVNAKQNKAPAANPGSNVTITLPVNAVKLTGSGSDEDGTITSYKWTKLSGPSDYTIVSPNAATTDIKGLSEGVYEFQLTVTDNDGATATGTVKITVLAVPNKPPVATVGKNVFITLPVNTASLSGSGTDPDGNVILYKWAKISGPSGFNIVNPNSPVTDVYNLTEGVYEFRLTVTDNNGATASAVLKVTVSTAENKPPVANAGEDITIVIPENEVRLVGSGSDPDGFIYSQQWSQLSGPTGANIILPDDMNTIVDGLVLGNYSFILTVIDDKGAVGRDTIFVTVAAGRESFTEGEFKIFPNPVIDQLTVELSNLLPYDKIIFWITDMNGRIVMKDILAVNGQKYYKESISLKLLSKGSYVVSFQLPNGRMLKNVKVLKIE